MKRLSYFFSSFQTRVTIFMVLAILFTALASDLLIYRFSLQAQFRQLREQLVIIAKTAAIMVDAEELMQIPLKPEGVNFPQYKSISAKLRKIQDVNPQIRYIYTLAKTENSNILQFIVDPMKPSREEKIKHLVAYPGRKYDASRFRQMLRSFDGPNADDKLMVDEWGVSLSGYAPILDASGKAVAILGVDIMADQVYTMQRQLHLRAIIVLIFGFVLSLILGIFISRRITVPLKKLVEGTRHIAREELNYRIKVGGLDEIKELGGAFNEMAVSLHKSRRRLHSYFYRTMQSLVRILEARDRYTKGHSERVAEYAETIAARMGFTPERVELLKQTAMLHDIGKLGIEDRILNKEGKLTDEEWETVRKHPIIGEDILSPILLNKEMLAMVRGHHERHDGRGYPDKIGSPNISVFTQILTIADSFDAMTSPRSYRPAMSREKAIGELKANKGAQFSPEIVEIFINLLKEEA